MKKTKERKPVYQGKHELAYKTAKTFIKENLIKKKSDKESKAFHLIIGGICRCFFGMLSFLIRTLHWTEPYSAHTYKPELKQIDPEICLSKVARWCINQEIYKLSHFKK